MLSGGIDVYIYSPKCKWLGVLCPWLLPLPEFKARGPSGGATRFRFLHLLPRRTTILLISSAIDVETIWRPPGQLLARNFLFNQWLAAYPRGQGWGWVPISLHSPTVTMANCSTATFPEHWISLRGCTVRKILDISNIFSFFFSK